MDSEISFKPKQDKIQYIWVEKYRPSILNDYVGNTLIKETFSSYIKSNDIPHLLLYGGPGTGKSTAAKILVKSIDCDSLYINASDERTLDVIQDKIKSFASSCGFNSRKILILDECLDENTLVTILRCGEVLQCQIKNLKDETDLVKSYNINKNKIEWRPFTLLDKDIQDVYEVELENGEVVICTESHKWYVLDPVTKTPIKMKLKDIISKKIESILTI